MCGLPPTVFEVAVDNILNGQNVYNLLLSCMTEKIIRSGFSICATGRKELGGGGLLLFSLDLSCSRKKNLSDN
jgi:hypothetical protein